MTTTNILVDATQVSASPKGVGLYTLNVLRQWLARDHPPTLTLLCSTPAVRRLLPEHRALNSIDIPWRNHLWHGLRSLPRVVSGYRPDAVWIPSETPLGSLLAPFGMVCHDVPRKIREAQSAAGRARQSLPRRALDRVDDRLIDRTLRRASVVFANSRYVARHLEQGVGVPPDRITLAPCAPGADFAAMAQGISRSAIRERQRLADGFVLTIFTGDERENIAIVPQVFDQLVADGLRHGLVVAGVRDAVRSDVEHLFARFGWKDRVRVLPFFGPEQQQDLAALYTAADIYLDLSLHEGFGMQVIEAMACGTPVVCSDRAALPEVAGDAAVLVDPTDPTIVSAAVSQLIRDRERLRQMVAAGRRRAGDFTWERTAETILSSLVGLERGRHAR